MKPTNNLMPETPSFQHYVYTLWRRFFGLNVSPVEPLLFVGGEFRPHQWSLLYAMGIRSVLSLQAEHEDQFIGAPPDRTLRIAVPDFTAPTISQITQGVDFITQSHAAQLPTLVHCHAGVGRAPLTTAAYLIAQRSLTSREALRYLHAARPIISINTTQLERLLEWEAYIR